MIDVSKYRDRYHHAVSDAALTKGAINWKLAFDSIDKISEDLTADVLKLKDVLDEVKKCFRALSSVIKDEEPLRLLNAVEPMLYFDSTDKFDGVSALDKLEKIFAMQKQFDERVQGKFDDSKYGGVQTGNGKIGILCVPTVGMHVDTESNIGGKILHGDELSREVVWQDFDWVKQLTFCLLTECVEIIDAIGWKHWKQLKMIDVAHLNEEIADAWHFLVSLTLRAGLSASDVLKEYEKKWAENQNRQDRKY